MKKQPTAPITLLLILLLAVFQSKAQQTNLSCSVTSVPFTQSLFPGVAVSQSSTGLSGWPSCTFGGACPARVVDANHANYARGTIAVTGSITLAVSDAANTYSAGNFAGYLLDGSALDVNLLSGMSIITYLGSTQQEAYTGSSLLALSSSLLSSGREIGFYTTKPFNKIELTIGAAVGLGSYDVYYAVLRGTGSCSTPALTCNDNNRLSFPAHPVVVDPALTGVSGAVTLSAISGSEKMTDSDNSNYTTISTTVSALGTASVGVRNVTGTYEAGTLAGFDIGNSALLNVSALTYVTVRTYKDGSLREQRSGNGLAIGATVLGTSDRQSIGFVTALDYDAIQLEISQPLTLSLGVTKVYGAVVRKFCAGPALTCNNTVAIDEAHYPVYLNGLRTGFSGIACASCSLYGTGNVIDGDAATYAVVDMTAGAISEGRISVRDALTDYPAGTFAGFDIENSLLVNVDLLDRIRVVTYLDGVYRQSFSGSTLLAGVPTGLLGASGRMTIGGIATASFDEAVLELDQTVSVNLGITKVYSVLLGSYCAGSIGCNSTYWLSSGNHPVYIDARHTGVAGLVCAACYVSDPENVLTPSASDYAQLKTVAGVLASASLAVRDAVSAYPAGTLAGFALRDPNRVLEVTLLRTIRISTYLGGVLQESRAGGELLDLSVLLPLISSGSSAYNIGFKTRLPFDEIKISATPVAGVVPVLNIYGAFVDTRYVDSLAQAQLCPRPPVAQDDHGITLLNTAYTGSLRSNDYDPAHSPLAYAATPLTPPAQGSVVIAANGRFTYTPAPGFTGIDSFAYSVCNAEALCATQWAYITIAPLPANPAAPIAHTDFSQTSSGTAVSGHARSNDADANGDALHYTVAQAPAHGSLVLSADGIYTYTPDSSFVGIDSARLQVCDGAVPAACVVSLLQVTVTANASASNRPNAHDDLLLTAAATPASGSVLRNDNDPAGSPVSATLVGSLPAGAGTLSLASNGMYTFTPAPGFTGNTSVTYRICNGAGGCDTATLSITVQPAAPLADSDHGTAVAGYAYTGSLRTNDRDPQHSLLTYATVPVTAPAHGTVTIAADGTFMYTPASGHTGIDSLQYSVCNSFGLCTEQWAFITTLPYRVPGANSALVAQTDFAETLAAVPVSGSARSNDLDGDGDALTYSTVNAPAHGSLVLAADGSYTYTPQNGFTGSDTAILQVCDAAACHRSLLLLTVSEDAAPSANDRPAAHDDLAATAAGSGVAGTVLRNDSDPNGDPVSVSPIGTLAPETGTIALLADGSYRFTPAPGFIGTAVIPYRLCDTGNPALCDTATLSIAVQPAPPRAGADHAGTYINTPYTGSLRPNDRDPQQSGLTYATTPLTAPANGTVAIAADGAFTYTPAAGFRGLDSLQYSVCNAFGLCATQRAYISVIEGRTYGGLNYAPVAQPDYNGTVPGGTVSGNVSGNDVDADGDVLAYSVLSTTAHGTLTLNANGTYSYTANGSFIGTDTAVLQVCDDASPAACVTPLLYIKVTPATIANNPPVAADDLFATPRGINLSGYVTGNDTDPDGDALTASLIDAMPAAAGQITFAPDGGFTFVPAADFTGPVSVRYQLCDNGTPGRCDTATLSIVVQQVIGPDFTPAIVFDSTNFTKAGGARDFYVRISELQNSANTGQVMFRILKPSAFQITWAAGTTLSQVAGGTAVSNSDWIISETSLVITGTLKPGITLPGSGLSRIGFRIARKPGIAANTMQSITASIGVGSGGDSNPANNQASIKVTAQ